MGLLHSGSLQRVTNVSEEWTTSIFRSLQPTRPHNTQTRHLKNDSNQLFYERSSRNTVFLFSKIILKFLSRILFPAMDLCNEVLSESQPKLKWSLNQQHTAEIQCSQRRPSFFYSQMKYGNGLRASNWKPLTYNISGGWRIGREGTLQSKSQGGNTSRWNRS